MANRFDYSPFLCPIIGGFGLAGSNTGFALNSDYTLGTGGACVGVRFHAPQGGVHLHYAYFFLHEADAEGQNLTCDLANYGASTTRAGTSIRAVTSAGGTAANKWIKFDFTAYSDTLTANEIYWVVVGDAAGNGDGYQIRTRNSSHATTASSAIAGTGPMYAMYTSTAGFTGNGTAPSYPVSFMLVFSDGTTIGHPYTQSATDTSATTERGLKIYGLTNSISIAGFVTTQQNTNVNTIQMYSGTTAPGGTVWAGFNGGSALTPTANQKANGVFLFPSVVTLEKDTVYRLTYTFSSAGNYPGYNECEDAATPGADAVACSLMAGNCCHCIDDTSGGWIDYDDATAGIRLSRISLIIADQVAPVAGGAGGGLPILGGSIVR